MQVKKDRGFTLVEIVLSLGVATFAITAVMALMSVSLGSSRASSDDTVLAAMSNGLVDDLRRQSFKDLPGASNVAAAAVPTPVALPATTFDGSGVRLKNAQGKDVPPDHPTAVQRGIYTCTVTGTGDVETLSPIPQGNGLQSVNLLSVTLSFSWRGQGTSTNSRVIHATIARY